MCWSTSPGQPALPSRFRKYSPHLNTQTGSSFPDGALCVLTAGSPTPVPDRKYCFELSTQRAPELQPRAWAPGARRSQVAQTSRLLCVCPTSVRPAALPLGSVHNDRRGHRAPRWPQFLRELTEGAPQSLDPPPPARAPPSASITCITQKGAGALLGPPARARPLGRSGPEDRVFLPRGTVHRSHQGPTAPYRTHGSWARTGCQQAGLGAHTLPSHSCPPDAEQHPAAGGRPTPAAWRLPPAPPQAYPGLGLQEHVTLHVLAGLAVGHSSLPHSIFAGIQRGRDVGTGSLASGLAAAVRGPRAACPPAWPRPRAATEGGALSTARKGGRALNGGHPGKKAAAWLGPAVGPGEGCSPAAQPTAEWRVPPIPAFPAPALSHLSPPRQSSHMQVLPGGPRR